MHFLTNNQSFLPGTVLDIGVMWMSKALLPSSSSSWYREGQEQSNTVGLCTHVLVFLSNPACRFLQRMGTTLLCPNMQPHQNLTTVTCSKGNLLRAVRGSKSLRNARKYPPHPSPTPNFYYEKGERRERRGRRGNIGQREDKGIIIGLYEIMCVKILKVTKHCKI